MWRRSWVLVLTALFARCTCVDLSTPRPYPCTVDGGAGTECPEGWRCGLEGFCHARDEGGPYVCTNDTHCEASWRCGADGRCVEANEGLLPNADAGSIVVQLGPRLLDQSPEAIAVSTSFTLETLCDGGIGNVSAVSIVSGGELRKIVYYEEGRSALPDGGYANNCTGVAPKPVFVDVVRAPVSGTALALAETGRGSLWLTDGGVVCQLPFTNGGAGAVSCLPGALGFTATELRPSSVGPVMAFSSSHYSMINLADGGHTAPATIDDATNAATEIRDVAVLEAKSGRESFAVAATDHGLFVTSLDGGTAGFYTSSPSAPWGPVGIPGYPNCDPAALTATPTHLRIGGAQNALISRYQDDRFETVTVTRPSLNVSSLGSCDSLPSPDWEDSKPSFYDQQVVSCGSCNSDSPTLWADTAARDGVQTIESVCYGATDNDRWVNWCDPANSRSVNLDELDTRLFSPSTKLSTSNPIRRAYAGAQGELWWDETDDSLTRLPITLARVPVGIIGEQDSVMAFTERVTLGTETPERKLIERQLYMSVPGAGFVGFRRALDEIRFMSGVVQQPMWMLARFESSANPFVIGVIPGFDFDGWYVAQIGQSEVFPPPYAAASATTPTGGQMLVVTAYDALLAADVTASALPTGTDDDVSLVGKPLLEVKVVPLSRTPISSVVLLPRANAAATGPLAEGFLIAGGRVFRFRAQSALVWRSDELALPEGDALEVWANGDRGRVGFSDGRVLSLPNRTVIADALPAGSGAVVDYADFCGHPFALTASGLHRLVSTSALVPATWVPLELPAGALVPGIGLSRAKLYGDGRGISLFLDTGKVLEVRGLSCVGP